MRRRLPTFLAPLLLLLAAFALKTALLEHFDTHPLLQPAGDMDSGVYARLAADVARGDLLLRGPGPVPYFVSPLYIYFLAAVHALSAGSLFAAKVVQIVLGTAVVGLVWAMTRRLFDDRAALVAGILYALTGIVSFHEILILQAALDPFLTALFLFLLAVALSPDQPKTSLKVNEEKAAAWAAAGAALGLFALNRPNVLPFAAVVAVGLVVRGIGARGERPLSPPFKENPLRTLGFAGAFLAGTAAIVALPLARNLIVSGEPVLISSHGGLNLLVGNGPGANGVYRWLDGITPSVSGQAADAKKLAERETGRPLTTREVSSFFARRAFSWMAEQPQAAVRLFARKIWYVFSNDELSLNFSATWYRRESVLLRLLAVGPWLLVPLGMAGLVLAVLGAGRFPGRVAGIWASFVPVYALLVAAFFVATRYRLPLAVPLAAGAGGAVSIVWTSLLKRDGKRDRKPVLVAACVALPCLLLALWPTGVDDGSSEEEMQWVLALIETGDVSESTTRLHTLAKTYPMPGVLWFRAGQAWAAAGRLDDAISALERARAIDLEQKETRGVLAAARERRGMERATAGKMSDAAADMEEAARLDPGNPAIRVNLAAILAEQGDSARARSLASEALALRPGYDKAEALLRALPK